MAQASYPDWLAREERHAARQPLRLTGTVDGIRTRHQPVEVIDLSSLGCRVRIADPMAVGSYVTFTSGSSPRLEGWVAWSGTGECGIDFAQPVPDAVVTQIMHRAD